MATIHSKCGARYHFHSPSKTLDWCHKNDDGSSVRLHSKPPVHIFFSWWPLSKMKWNEARHKVIEKQPLLCPPNNNHKNPFRGRFSSTFNLQQVLLPVLKPHKLQNRISFRSSAHPEWTPKSIRVSSFIYSYFTVKWRISTILPLTLRQLTAERKKKTSNQLLPA